LGYIELQKSPEAIFQGLKELKKCYHFYKEPKAIFEGIERAALYILRADRI